MLLLTLSFAGLRRGEALALSWRDVDFERESIRVRGNWSYGRLVTTKGGRIRSVPLVPQLAQRLALLGQRKRWTDIDDPVFVNEYGGRLDGSALRRRYVRARDQADLRPLRLHDLRHAFASLAIDHASPVEVQAWARPPRRADDRALHALQEPPRRGQATGQGVRGRRSAAVDTYRQAAGIGALGFRTPSGARSPKRRCQAKRRTRRRGMHPCVCASRPPLVIARVTTPRRLAEGVRLHR
ncbi:MAG: tyrosine-type recombinase/integrase [Solirubrobacteraceae bacterium]